MPSAPSEPGEHARAASGTGQQARLLRSAQPSRRRARRVRAGPPRPLDERGDALAGVPAQAEASLRAALRLYQDRHAPLLAGQAAAALASLTGHPSAKSA